MLIGMIANPLYQGTIAGVTNLVEERENDFTAELFVAPISRYAVLLGKMLGSGVASLVSLVGIFAMVFVMQIPMNLGDLLRVLALAPILALAGGRWAIFFIGFVHDPKVAGAGRRRCWSSPRCSCPARSSRSPASTGLLGFLAKVMPDDLQHRPGPQHLLRGQARVRAAVLHPAARPRRDASACSSCSRSSGTCLFVAGRPQPLMFPAGTAVGPVAASSWIGYIVNMTLTISAEQNASAARGRRRKLADELIEELMSTPREKMNAYRAWHRGALSLVHLNVLSVLEAEGPMSMGRSPRRSTCRSRARPGSSTGWRRAASSSAATTPPIGGSSWST